LIYRHLLFFCCIGSLFLNDLPGQAGYAGTGVPLTHGFDPGDWLRIQERWIKSQPAILVSTHAGEHLLGQPIYAGKDTLYLLASTDLPLELENHEGLHKIPYSEVESLLLQKGGNWMTRSRRSSNYRMPGENISLSKAYQESKKHSVYRDSLSLPLTMDEAFAHSPLLRQVFRRKRLRVSVNMGPGTNRILSDARRALEASSLPSPQDWYGSDAILELFDLSWRFMDRIIAGGQLAAHTNSSTLYAYGGNGSFSNSYNYDVGFYEHRLYAEYAFFHLDRYFTRRWELLAGAGLLMGKTQWALYYQYDEYSDLDNPTYGEALHTQSDAILGFQLRTAFHCYILPGFSLWSGLEANFYSPWTIGEVEVPSNNPAVPFVLPEHDLNFNCLRFKIGVSIYL